MWTNNNNNNKCQQRCYWAGSIEIDFYYIFTMLSDKKQKLFSMLKIREQNTDLK